MALIAVQQFSWGPIAKLNINETKSGWTILSSEDCYAYIQAPDGTKHTAYCDEPVSILGVIVTFLGLWSYCGYSIYPPEKGTKKEGCSGGTYLKITIPSGSYIKYAEAPPSPPAPQPEEELPPMELVSNVSKCFDYVRYNLRELDNRYSFDASDFFGEPKTR